MTDNNSLTSSNQPRLITGNLIQETGLTLLATGGSKPSFDIVLVHGLQGHPETTWCYHQQVDHNAVKKGGRKWKFGKKTAEKAELTDDKTTSKQNDETTSKRDESTIYWPIDLLASDLPAARIFTYGYDSRISHFFGGPANQNTITDNGRALLSSIASQRQDCAGRPLLLIVHSLGGIVVKSALRLSSLTNDNDADLKDVYQSTFAILFFGTPHRGSDWVDAGQIARKFAALLGFSTSDYNLRALQSNNEILGILRDEFARMLGEKAFCITSFQESKGFKGIVALDGKIVGPDSSGLDHFLERKIPINANHLDMCKFGTKGPTRSEYDEKVHSEIVRHWRRVSKMLEDQKKMIMSVATSTINKDCNELLQSLESVETSSRYHQVEKAHSQTFEWLFQKSELGFMLWLEYGTGLYWCRGHAATGKSTLMKWLYEDSRTIQALDLRVGRKIRASFFFHDRGAELQKSFKGLLQGIVYQILQGARELLPIILPVWEQILRRPDASWTEADTHTAFRIILDQQTLPLDITLFLDALDEYAGTPESIATFLYNSTNVSDSAQTKIRVCFSSRPLQIFLDKFSSVPGFDIHDHTSADIKLVIQSRMSQNPRMCQYMQATTLQDQRLAQQFAAEVHLKAEGIFLWVKLVLDELLNEFTAGESLYELINKLGFLPRALEDFYQHTLDRMPNQYRTDAKVIFEVLRCAIHPLRVHDVFEIWRCTRAKTLVDCPSCTDFESQGNHQGFDRWIRSRTGGLVQLVPLVEEDYGGGRVEHYYCPVPLRRGQSVAIVQFLHQTVKTFSQRSPWPTHPMSDRFPCLNGHAYIAKYILALLFQHRQSDSDVGRRFYVHDSDEEDASNSKDFFWGRYGAFHLIDNLLRQIQLAESDHPRILLGSLVEFGDDRISDLFNIGMWTTEIRRTAFNNLWAVAVICDLCELLEALYERDEGKQANVNSQSLLHLAVAERPSWQDRFDAEKRVRTIRILMDHGADPTKFTDGCTPYELLCKRAMADSKFSSHEYQRALLTLVTPLLQRGQAPNARIKFRERYTARHYLDIEQCLLHYAAELADRELVYALLEHGADVNPLDDAGSTPLDCVCDGPRRSFRAEQLSDSINQYLDGSLESRPAEALRRRMQAASLLISRGGRFGISPRDANAEFFKERKPVTRTQVKALRNRGIDIDEGIVRSSQTQINGGIASLLKEPFSVFKKYTAAWTTASSISTQDIPEDELEKVTLSFDQLVDSRVLADAIEAEHVTEILYQEFKKEYSTVLLTIAQFRKLFFSGKERLRQFLLVWTFGFQYLDRPHAVSNAFGVLLKEAVLNVPGFADYVRPKIDFVHGGPGFNLPSGASTVRIMISIHLDTKDEEEEAEATTKGKRKRKPKHQKARFDAHKRKKAGLTDGGDELDDEDKVEQWLEELRIPYPGPDETQNNAQKAAAGRASFNARNATTANVTATADVSMPLAYSGVTILADIEPHKFLEASSTSAVQLSKTTAPNVSAQDNSTVHKRAEAVETVSSVLPQPQAHLPWQQLIAKFKFTSKKDDFVRYVSTGLMETTAASTNHDQAAGVTAVPAMNPPSTTEASSVGNASDTWANSLSRETQSTTAATKVAVKKGKASAPNREVKATRAVTAKKAADAAQMASAPDPSTQIATTTAPTTIPAEIRPVPAAGTVQPKAKGKPGSKPKPKEAAKAPAKAKGKAPAAPPTTTEAKTTPATIPSATQAPPPQSSTTATAPASTVVAPSPDLGRDAARYLFAVTAPVAASAPSASTRAPTTAAVITAPSSSTANISSSSIYNGRLRQNRAAPKIYEG